MPLPAVMDHDRVLDGEAGRISGQDGAAAGRVERRGVVGLQQVHPPVRAARSRAAHIEPP